jgi:nucleoside-diphosphate-sugar epimerase
LLKASKAAGARAFVHISAAGIIMDDRGSPVHNADESAPTYSNSFSAYIASKARGEAAVLAANTSGFRTIALRPPALWGPGDPFSRALPHAIKSGQFAFINGGNHAFATCHLDNVIEAIQCALERGTGGRAYFIRDTELRTFREFVGTLASLQNLSIEKLGSVPYRLAFTIGRIMEIVWAVGLRKGDPPISRSMVRMLGQEFSIDDTAARRELGYVGRTSRTDGLRSYGVLAESAA